MSLVKHAEIASFGLSVTLDQAGRITFDPRKKDWVGRTSPMSSTLAGPENFPIMVKDSNFV